MKESVGGYAWKSNVKHFRFEKDRVGFAHAFSRSELERIGHWDIERFEREFGHEIVFKITSLMARGDKTTEQWHEVPATWWDHFKLYLNLRFKWKLSVRTAKLASKTIIKHFCPHLTSSPNQAHIEFLIHGPIRWEDVNNER